MRNAAAITQGGLGLFFIFTLITLYAWYAEHDHETLYRAEIMEHIVDPCYTEAAKMLYGKMTPAGKHGVVAKKRGGTTMEQREHFKILEGEIAMLKTICTHLLVKQYSNDKRGLLATLDLLEALPILEELNPDAMRTLDQCFKDFCEPIRKNVK